MLLYGIVKGGLRRAWNRSHNAVSYTSALCSGNGLCLVPYAGCHEMFVVLIRTWRCYIFKNAMGVIFLYSSNLFYRSTTYNECSWKRVIKLNKSEWEKISEYCTIKVRGEWLRHKWNLCIELNELLWGLGKNVNVSKLILYQCSCVKMNWKITISECQRTDNRTSIVQAEVHVSPAKPSDKCVPAAVTISKSVLHLWFLYNSQCKQTLFS
jgi:hypothetical protein